MPDRPGKAEWAFGGATAVLAILALAICLRFAKPPMIAFGEILAITTVVPPLFYVMTTQPRSLAKRVGGIASCVIWLIGIALTFMIPPHSQFIFIPDAMLMLGFFPLLYMWKYSWPWLLFGVLNFGIGILLMVIEFSPDNLFPPELLGPKHHLGDYHPPIVWTTTGIIATTFGAGRLIKNVYLMIRKARSAA
jgi:hypothetical protein